MRVAPAAPEPEPLPSASPIDAHRAPVQETRRRSGRAGTGQAGRGQAVAGEILGVIGVVASIALPIVAGFLL